MTQNHKIREWAKLERITMGHLVQPPCPGRVVLEHMSLEGGREEGGSSGGRLQNIPGQSVPVQGHLDNKKFISFEKYVYFCEKKNYACFIEIKMR